MQIRNSIKKAAVAMALILPLGALAQSSSINTFSPYTFYGIGDLSNQGPAHLRSMGGAGSAYHHPWFINTLNPASYSAVGQKSFLFNFGMEGSNHYLQSKGLDNITRKSSFNTFNVRDVAVLFPLAKKIGVSVNVSPYSNIGYRVDLKETDIDIITNLGEVRYKHEGEGGISQIKAGLGAKIFKNVSVGAEMIYYMGSIDRMYGVYITPVTGSASTNSVVATNTETISKLMGGFGAQWDIIASSKRLLTLGATYQIGGKLNSKFKTHIPSSNYVDTVSYIASTSGHLLPQAYTIGAYYHTPKFSVGLDYASQLWGKNPSEESGKITYRDTHSVKLGGQFTPNAGDVRRFYNRWTYRAGLRYNEYYMNINGKQINDQAITFGVGIPLTRSAKSNINLGLDLGQRGSLTPGLVREKYFKVSVGLSLFGEDYWFIKRKYN